MFDFGPLNHRRLDEVDNGPGSGFALRNWWQLQLGKFADRQLHQFVFRLQPIIEIMPMGASPFEIKLVGTSGNLLGR